MEQFRASRFRAITPRSSRFHTMTASTRINAMRSLTGASKRHGGSTEISLFTRTPISPQKKKRKLSCQNLRRRLRSVPIRTPISNACDDGTPTSAARAASSRLIRSDCWEPNPTRTSGSTNSWMHLLSSSPACRVKTHGYCGQPNKTQSGHPGAFQGLRSAWLRAAPLHRVVAPESQLVVPRLSSTC